MKLRINTKLRAALIAAISTVGFTLTQAQAAWEGGANEGSEYYTNTGRTNLHLTNTSDALITFTAEQNHVTAGIAELVVKDMATVRVRGGNHWGPGRAFDMLTIDSIKAGDGSGTVFVNAEKYNDSQAVSNSTATVLGINGTLGGVQNYGVLTLGADGGTINASGAIMNNSGATLTLNGTYTFDTTDANNYVTRTEGDVVWSDEANQQGFKKSTGSTFYVIKGATEGTGFSATGVEKESSGNYYFTAGEVTDHSKFYVNAATATLGEDFSGQLVVNKADATVTVDGAIFSGTITADNKANLIVQNGGKLTLANKTAFGSTDNTFTIGAGSTIDLNGQADGNYKYTLAGGTITNSGGNIGDGSSQTVALKLTEDSTVNAGSGHDFRLLGRGYAATSLDLGGKTLVKTGAGLFGLFNTTVTAGTIEVREGTFEFNTAHGTASSAANITFNGGNATGAMNLTGDITLTAQQTVSSGVGINAQNHGLTLDGAANLTLTGTITNVSGITKAGTGTATITASGSLNRSIDVQQGSLVLSGTYAIDDIALDPDSTVIYYNEAGAEGTSGFRNVAGAKSAYTVAQDASITATGATFTVGGQTVQLNEQGKYLIAGSTDYTTLWANRGDTVDYAAYVTAAQAHETTISSVRVADGGNVNLNGGTVANLRFDTDGAVAGIEGTGTISSLTGAGTLDLHAGARAAMTGTVSVNTGNSLNTTGAGALTVETLKVNGGTVNVASNLTVTGGGDGKGGNNSKGLFLTGSGSTVNINGGTTTVTGAVYTNGGGIAINVGTGDAEATLVARRIELGDNGGGTGSFTIGQKGKVVVTGNEDYRNDTANPQKNTSLQMAEWGQQMTDTVQGKLYAQGATAFMSNDADSTINIDGGTMAVKGIVCSNVTANRAHTLSIANGGKLIMGERGLAAEPGSWNFSVADGEIGMYADTTVVGRDLTLAGDLTFNTAKYTWSGEGAAQELTEGEEGGTLTVSGTITGSGNITKKGAGSLIVDTLAVTGGSLNVTEGDASIGSIVKTGEGDYTMTATGTTKLVSGIDLLEGKLTMSGSYDISDIYVDGEPTYEGGVNDGNGFAVVDGKAQVVTVTEDTTLDAAAATFTWGGSTVTLDETGAASVSGANYGTFYVFTESETVTQAKSQEGEHGPLSAIYVEEGATLTVDQDINASLIDSWSTGTVSIAQGKTVNGTMEGVTLAGSGTYALTSGTADLGADTTLDDGWTGVVRISNATKGDGNSAWISALANGESWVEFVNFTGYDRAWASSFSPAVTANIILTDDGEHAAWNLTAFASSTYTMVISGDVKGDGTFKTSGGTAAQSQAIEFRGDISDWKGAFVADANGMRRVAFTGEAMTVNASIAREGAGALNLVVGNGSDQTDAVFHEVVSVTSVEVKANDSATFLGQLTTSTVTNAGSVVFNTLEGLSQTITNSGDVTFNANFEVSGFHVTAGEFGFYDTEGNFSVDGNGYAGTSDSYITIVNGGNVEADGIEVTQEGTVYTMNNSGRAQADDGGVTDEYTYHVNTDTVDISAIKTDGHASKVEVKGGTLNVDQSTDLAITVMEEGTLTGENLDASEIGIGEGAAAYFAQGLESGGVKFSSGEDSVDVYNYGDSAAYSLNNSAMTVSAQSITKITGEDVTVSNWLTVEEITNVQGGKLTLNGMEDAVVVANITVGPNSAVEILDNQTSEEITVTVTEELAAGGGTLLANLVMADDSALLVNGVQKALHVGSTLTMGSNIALDETTLRALDGLAIGDYFWLIDAADEHELVYEDPTGEDAWFDSVFSRLAADGDYKLNGDFNIVFDDELDAFGLKKFSDTPEPTTGTLSLLALAALAARRRRK